MRGVERAVDGAGAAAGRADALEQIHDDALRLSLRDVWLFCIGALTVAMAGGLTRRPRPAPSTEKPAELESRPEPVAEPVDRSEEEPFEEELFTDDVETNAFEPLDPDDDGDDVIVMPERTPEAADESAGVDPLPDAEDLWEADNDAPTSHQDRGPAD